MGIWDGSVLCGAWKREEANEKALAMSTRALWISLCESPASVKPPGDTGTPMSLYSLFLWPGRELDLKELNTAKHLPCLPFLHLPKALLGAGFAVCCPSLETRRLQDLGGGMEKSATQREHPCPVWLHSYFLKVKNTAAPNGKHLTVKRPQKAKSHPLQRKGSQCLKGFKMSVRPEILSLISSPISQSLISLEIS